jgi:FtsP/CotA-like multicopper oxidase with cupredoxin domain/plastocyanin
MATIEYWIQLENRPWDASPHNIDRITGLDIKETTGMDPVDVTISSPPTAATPVSKTRKMFNPLRDGDGKVKDALILRRYKPPVKADKSDAWTVPDDRKVNPWDLNELDPTDKGTMGTIPGPVIECNVGDAVVVNFRNMDLRSRLVVGSKKVCFPLPFGGEFCLNLPSISFEPIEIEKRVHSLHPHGFVFKPTSDGAYPLSPADPAQPIPASEAAAWAAVPGFSGSLKKGDRVPPEGTFRYEWSTFGWPTTAGVWLYHDHSICDMENVELGAIGIIVIHNPADTLQEVDIRLPNDPLGLDPGFLPGGSPNGSPVVLNCFPLPFLDDIRVLPQDLAGLGEIHAAAHAGRAHASSVGQLAHLARVEHPVRAGKSKGRQAQHLEPDEAAPEIDRMITRGDLLLELNDKLDRIQRICFARYRTPPSKGLFLQLFHTLNGVSGMAINGRLYMGNTPTIVAGRDTRMRFGVVGMGSDVHTFHIHGHRWIIPGPQGNTPNAIQGSALVQPVSQFEDTRIFGAANSFVFTIDGKSGSFMRAGSPSSDDAVGEWHMHCHVLSHMMTGMMGTLLIVRGGELALALPVGFPCEHGEGGGDHGNGGGGGVLIVNMQNSAFSPQNLAIANGSQVQFVNKDGFAHTVDWDSPGSPSNSGTINAQGAAGDKYTTPVMNAPGTYNYHCAFHGAPGAGMHGSITVNP